MTLARGSMHVTSWPGELQCTLPLIFFLCSMLRNAIVAWCCSVDPLWPNEIRSLIAIINSLAATVGFTKSLLGSPGFVSRIDIRKLLIPSAVCIPPRSCRICPCRSSQSLQVKHQINGILDILHDVIRVPILVIQNCVLVKEVLATDLRIALLVGRDPSAHENRAHFLCNGQPVCDALFCLAAEVLQVVRGTASARHCLYVVVAQVRSIYIGINVVTENTNQKEIGVLKIAQSIECDVRSTSHSLVRRSGAVDHDTKVKRARFPRDFW